MKCNISFIVFLLLFSSCSQKHFSFRKTIKVNHQKQEDWVLIESDTYSETDQNEELVWILNEMPANDSISIPINSEAIPVANSPKDLVSLAYKEYGYSISYLNHPPKLITKQKDNVAEKNDSNNDEPKDRALAGIVGFIFGVIGFVAFLSVSVFSFASVPLFIMGLILSIKGLKSNASGFALAGIILNSLGILFWLAVMLVIALILSYYQ